MRTTITFHQQASLHRQPPRLARAPTRVAATASEGGSKSLKRSLSAHSRCEIASPEGVLGWHPVVYGRADVTHTHIHHPLLMTTTGVQCYCNVIRSASNDNGEEGFQFVVVFMKDDDVLESSEYEYYQSEWCVHWRVIVYWTVFMSLVMSLAATTIHMRVMASVC